MNKVLAIALAAIVTLSGSADLSAQTFELQINDDNCRVPLTGAVQFVTEVDGTTRFETSTSGSLPAGCPGAGTTVQLTSDATGPIEAGDSVTLSWVVPTTGFDCVLNRNNAAILTVSAAQKPTGSSIQTPTGPSTYEMACTATGGTSGAFANAQVDVQGVVECASSPAGSSRLDPIAYKNGSTGAPRTGSTHIQLFGPWPGTTGNGLGFIFTIPRTQYISIPFTPNVNGNGFTFSQIIPPFLPYDAVRFTITEGCYGGFGSQDAICTTQLGSSSSGGLASFDKRVGNFRVCGPGLQDGVEYFLNIGWLNAADQNSCGTTQCEGFFAYSTR